MNALLPLVIVGALACAPLASQAQSAIDRHDLPGRAGPPVTQKQFGRYTVRANAISSDVLPAVTARRHGIDRATDRGVLNVVVLEQQADGAQVTVPAEVSATKRNLLGQTETIAMREIAENDRVSYLGTFGFAPLRNIRFAITVRPTGSAPLRLQFEDRFVVR